MVSRRARLYEQQNAQEWPANLDRSSAPLCGLVNPLTEWMGYVPTRKLSEQSITPSIPTYLEMLDTCAFDLVVALQYCRSNRSTLPPNPGVGERFVSSFQRAGLGLKLANRVVCYYQAAG
ncbi:hypothetical protein N7513_001860 [Penicillium frequentans]|nr:hypothetical protein N7513_001860 [Penicillium glabrum]